MSDSVVSVERLSKSYVDGTQAVVDVEFTVEKGQIVGLIGANGAGKSTTLNMMGTVIKPSAGNVRIFGQSIHDPPKVRPLIGMAMQGAGLDPFMTVQEHFIAHGLLHGIDSRTIRNRCDQLGDEFSLRQVRDVPLKALSGGTQRRLCLALAVFHEPRIVLLDEPTVGLDPNSRRDFWNLLLRLKQGNIAIMLSSHYMDEIDRVCDHVLVMSSGKIVASGTSDELQSEISSGRYRLKLNAPDAVVQQFCDTLGEQIYNASKADIVANRNVIIFESPLSDDCLETILASAKHFEVTISELGWSAGSLDDVFGLYVTEQDTGQSGGRRNVVFEPQAQARRGRA